MKKLKMGKTIVLMLIACLMLAACGNAGQTGGGTNSGQVATNGGNTAGKAEATNAKENSTNAEKASVREISHGLGKTKIEGTPVKIVALEWTYVEDLLALGIQPVGVADPKGYAQYVNAEAALDAGVADVGTRQEPNLEAIAALQPDLILTVDYRTKPIYDKLTDIAPTIAFSPYQEAGGIDQYQEMIDTFNTIADVTGKKAEAEQVLKKLDETYTAVSEKIKAAGKENAKFTLIQAYSSKNTPTMRIFTNNSLAVKTLEKIGLKNAFTDPAYETYGFSEKSVEALPAVQDSNLLYIVQDDDNIFEKQLKDNQVWKNLNFVKEKRTYALGGDAWVFGGPLSAEVIVNRVASLLAP